MTESAIPRSLTLARTMAVILRTVMSPNCPFSHNFALNLFAYWMAHPEASINADKVEQLLGLAQGRCESQDEVEALAFIREVGISSFRPGNNFPWSGRHSVPTQT